MKSEIILCVCPRAHLGGEYIFTGAVDNTSLYLIWMNIMLVAEQARMFAKHTNPTSPQSVSFQTRKSRFTNKKPPFSKKKIPFSNQENPVFQTTMDGLVLAPDIVKPITSNSSVIFTAIKYYLKFSLSCSAIFAIE